jgi:hypothetical protein
MTDELERMLKLLGRTEENQDNSGCIVYLWKENRDQNLPEYDEELTGFGEFCRPADCSRFCAHGHTHVL